MEIRICIKCKLKYPLDDKNFYIYGTDKAGNPKFRKDCITCYKARVKKRADKPEVKRVDTAKKHMRKERVRIFLFEIYRHAPCVDCGLIDPEVVVGDHVRGKKIAGLSAAIEENWSHEKIMKEVAKVDWRCVKCHTIKTGREQNSYRHHYKLLYDTVDELMEMREEEAREKEKLSSSKAIGAKDTADKEERNIWTELESTVIVSALNLAMP